MPKATEAYQTWMRGQNGLIDPAILKSEVASRLYNVTVRNGLAESRPGRRDLTVPVQGRFQGLFEYRLNSADYLILVVSGQVWQLHTQNNTWLHLATFPTTDFDRAYFVQADRYGIVQNGIYDPVENWPIIFQESTVVDNLETQYMSGNALVTVKDFTGNAGGPSAIRVPIGKSMAYGHGRLFVAVSRYYDDGAANGMPQQWRSGLGLRFWMAGDVLQPGNVQTILVFTAGYFLAEGLAFSMPTEMGFITAMAFLRNAESGSGLGALIIFAQRGAAAFAVNIQRKTWLSAGFGQVLFTSSGTRSPWAVEAVNSDLVYYGDNGLRTLKYSASSEAGTGGLATAALSPEVTNFTDFTEHRQHDPYVTVAHVDNYIFFSAGGESLPDGSVAFKGILPWDLASFQVSGETPNRVFAGAWCGQLVHALAGYRPTSSLAAIYRSSATGDLALGVFDDFGALAHTSQIRTAYASFRDERGASVALRRKTLARIDAMFDRIVGDVSVRVRWQWDGSGVWYTSTVRKFSGAGSTGLFRIALPEATGSGFSCQFAIEWHGRARLRIAIMQANVLEVFDGDDSMCTPAVLLAGEDEGFGCPEAF